MKRIVLKKTIWFTYFALYIFLLFGMILTVVDFKGIFMQQKSNLIVLITFYLFIVISVAFYYIWRRVFTRR